MFIPSLGIFFFQHIDGGEAPSSHGMIPNGSNHMTVAPFEQQRLVGNGMSRYSHSPGITKLAIYNLNIIIMYLSNYPPPFTNITNNLNIIIMYLSN